MALTVLDGAGVSKSTKTTLDGTDHVPHFKADSLPDVVLAEGESHIGTVGPTKGTRTHSTAAPTTTAGSVLAANVNRKVAVFANDGDVTVYLGSTAGVTTSNGYPLLPDAVLVDDLSTGAWYAITASGTGDLRIIEIA